MGSRSALELQRGPAIGGGSGGDRGAAAGLANNYALDRGPAGVVAAADLLEEAGIRSLGVGGGVDGEAKAPLLIEMPHGVVGVVAFGGDYDFARIASPRRAGTLASSVTAVTRGLALARQAGACWVVAFVH